MANSSDKTKDGWMRLNDAVSLEGTRCLTLQVLTLRANTALAHRRALHHRQLVISRTKRRFSLGGGSKRMFKGPGVPEQGDRQH